MVLPADALALWLFVVLASGAVTAHRPIVEDRETSGYDNAIYLPDPAVSWAIYAFLGPQDEVDVYCFDVRGSLDLFTNIIVPDRDVYRDFRPSCAIVGPGMNGTVAVPFVVSMGLAPAS